MDQIDAKRNDRLIELGYSFEISWKGYRVEYNAEFIHGAAVYTGGYDYKEPHWKHKAANRKDFWLQALSTAEQHHRGITA